jgi:hypothetical protein
LRYAEYGLVALRLRSGQVQRGEDLRLVVLGILLRQGVEGLRARELAGPLAAIGEVGVVGGDRLDVVALALGLGADAAALLDRGGRRRGGLRRGALSGERVVHQQGGDAPGGDGAARVVGQHLAERLLAGGVPERVQHRHGLLQLGLHLGVARVRELDLAEVALVLAVLAQGGPGHDERQCGRSGQRVKAHDLLRCPTGPVRRPACACCAVVNDSARRDRTGKRGGGRRPGAVPFVLPTGPSLGKIAPPSHPHTEEPPCRPSRPPPTSRDFNKYKAGTKAALGKLSASSAVKYLYFHKFRFDDKERPLLLVDFDDALTKALGTTISEGKCKLDAHDRITFEAKKGEVDVDKVAHLFSSIGISRAVARPDEPAPSASAGRKATS